MLGDSAVLGTGGGSSAGDAAVAAAAAAGAASSAGGAHDGGDTAAGGGGGGGGGSNSGDDGRGGEEGDRSFGGNRWPRQETLALLKIRSDMGVAFRDASVKGPLWEEVSRKMAELGYHRNAKKCKEKFENVYKYHKRTKEGRSGKSDGKTYRFFDQLEALENNPAAIQSPTPSKPPQQSAAALPATPVSVVVTTTSSSLPLSITAATPTTTVPLPPLANTTTHTTVPPHSTTTVPSTTATLPMAVPQVQAILNTTPSMNLTTPSYPQTYFPPSTTTANPTISNNPPPPHTITPLSFPNIPSDFLSNSSSSSTSSEETTTLEGGIRRHKRKRKWKDFFERLMKEVIEKQEELQKRFLEAIEKRERERVAREEAWRLQEMQRINREREILAQERSMAAAKDAAVMAFLQKIAEQQNLGPALNSINIPQQQQQQQVPQESTATPTPQQVQTPTPAVQQTAPVIVVPQAPPLTPQQQQQQQHHQVQQQQQQVTSMEIIKGDNNGESLMTPSSSRWPKVEVEALIKLRTSLDTKYQETGPKGPLWEEISALMRKMGYNRNAKRCKEKWENINKYFKKVKESNKRRPEDSKTCPYFHQLDALYREKSSRLESSGLKPEGGTMMAPLMVQPEQQWPPQQPATGAPEVTMEDAENVGRHREEDEEYYDDNDDDDKDGGDDDDDDEEDDEGGGNYEIVASKPASVGASTR